MRNTGVQRRWWITTAVLVAAIAGLCGRAEAREFRAADTQVEDYPTVQALLHLNRLVFERTGGRHQIRVFHSRQLGEERDTIEQTKVGAIDLNRTNVAPIAQFVPEAAVLVLPFLFRSVQHFEAVIDGPIGENILAAFEPHGFVGLAFYDSGARSFYTKSKPIRSVADLKGLRIRIQASDTMAEFMRALGAEPVTVPYGQVLTALTAQLIDGAENNWPSYVTTGHYQLARFYSLTEHTMAPEVLVMSAAAWKTLSPEDQSVFRQAARESSRFMREQWRAWEKRSREQAEREGATISEITDRRSFEAAVKPLYERALTDPKLRDFVEQIRQIQ